MAEEEKKKIPVRKIIKITITLILVSLFAYVFFSNIFKQDNEMKSVFGVNFAIVQTGSMVDGGFDVGDFVLIKKINAEKTTLKVGDIIVFYYGFCDYYDQIFQSQIENNPQFKQAHTMPDDPKTWQKPTAVDPNKDYRATQKDAIKAGAILVFHRIIGVYYDDYGNKYFETLGDSNEEDVDDVLVRDDFVVAEYGGPTPVISAILGFIISPVGLIVVFLIPVAFMLLMQFLSFVNEMRVCSTVSNLIKRKISIRDVNTKKVDLGFYLSTAEKAFLYDITPKEDKPDMAIVLWKDTVAEALTAYETSRDDFYKFFEKDATAKDIKRLHFYKLKAQMILENPDITEIEAEQKAKNLFKGEKDDANS